MSVNVLFLPDRVSVTAEPGEPLLDIANRAGVLIRTGCLKGACHACKVQIQGQDKPILACVATLPIDQLFTIVHIQPAPVQR